MNRLAAMQDWPLLTVRAVTAVLTALSRFALGITINGSLPPSSIITFLIRFAAEIADLDAGALAPGQRRAGDARRRS